MPSNNSNEIYPKRLVDRLNAYWDMLRGTSDVPLASRFNGGSVADVYEHCLKMTVDSRTGVKVYHCEYIGRELAPAFGKDLANRYFTANDGSNISKDLKKALEHTVDNRCFYRSEGHFVNIKGQIVKYRDCIMPFEDVNHNIKMLVIGISWRAFS